MLHTIGVETLNTYIFSTFSILLLISFSANFLSSFSPFFFFSPSLWYLPVVFPRKHGRLHGERGCFFSYVYRTACRKKDIPEFTIMVKIILLAWHKKTQNCHKGSCNYRGHSIRCMHSFTLRSLKAQVFWLCASLPILLSQISTLGESTSGKAWDVVFEQNGNS